MAKDFFSSAAHEYKESARETRLRKRLIVSVLIFSVVPIVYAFNSVKDFPVNIPVGEALDNPANQIILAKVVFGLLGGVTALLYAGMLLTRSLWLLVAFLLIAFLDMGVVVLTDLLGLNIVQNRGLGAAYIGCILLPILTIVLMIDQKRKKR